MALIVTQVSLHLLVSDAFAPRSQPLQLSLLPTWRSCPSLSTISPCQADGVAETSLFAQDSFNDNEQNDLVTLSDQGSANKSYSTTTLPRAEKVKFAFITFGVILSIAKLYQISGAGTWRYYMAGGLCAAASHSVPVPIDVVKTRKQVDPALEGASFLEASRMIIRQDGWIALLDGLGATTVGYLIEGAMKFGVYEVLKPVVRGFLKSHSSLNNQWAAYVVSGFAAGLAASAVLCPMEALRIRMVAERDFAPKGWVDGVRRMIQSEGSGFLTMGLPAMIYKQVPYTITKNVSFDFFAKTLYVILVSAGTQLTPTVKLCVPFAAALLASILSCVSSQPGDMLLSLVNAHGGRKGTREAFKEIMNSNKGIKGFFVGMKTRFLHVGIIVTLQLLLYDLMKRLCGIEATGL